jgi:predicted nucleic acid-binding Zn ribbon protein
MRIHPGFDDGCTLPATAAAENIKWARLSPNGIPDSRYAMVPPPNKRKPSPIASAVESFLDDAGLTERVRQAAVIPGGAKAVGAAIAAVTEPRSVSADGTLFVFVKTHAWMSELTMMERDLVRTLNAGGAHTPVRRIRWQLMR